MSRALLIATISACALMVSCAHKDKQEPTTPTEQAEQNKDSQKAMPKTTVDAGTKSDGSEVAYTCDVAGDKRMVKMDKGQKRCEVHYTKQGQTQQVAWGEAHQEICQSTFDQIRSNIEGRGFKCQNGLETGKDDRKTASK